MNTAISLSIENGKIIINVEKYYLLNENQPFIKPKNVALSLPIINFAKNETDVFLLFEPNLSFTQDFQKFQAAELSENMTPDKKAKQKNGYQLISFSYELPQDPLLALHAIAIFDNYHTQINNCNFAKRPLKNNIDEHGHLTKCLLKFYDNLFYCPELNNESDLLETSKSKYYDNHKLLKKIIDLSNPPIVYQPALEKIKTFIDFCALEKMSLSDCLNNSRLNKLILKNHNAYLLVNGNLDPSHKRAIFDEIKTDLLRGYASIKWDKTIERIYAAMIYQLYAPCLQNLAMPAYDGNEYSADYTEIQFLKHIQNNLTFDGGRFYLKNLSKNPAYLLYYAEGRRNYDIFEKELRHLGKYIGLKFEVNGDFHRDQIILTRQSGNFLEKKGFAHVIELNGLLENVKKSLSTGPTLFNANSNNALVESAVIEPEPILKKFCSVI